MSESIDEQLSALADDELPEQEAPLLLRRISRDPELVARLGRYYTIRESLHGGLTDAVDGGVAAGVAEALEHEAPLAEEPVSPQGTGSARRWAMRLGRPAAGAAIAASVAVIAVTLWSTPETARTPSSGAPAVVASAPSPQASPAGGELARTVSVGENSGTQAREQWQRLDPQVQQRLNGYLVNHSENATVSGPGGVLNYVRIAGHERSQ
ncbi:sigma-E factor negative regulatory protein [Arhodomonas sp. AD133]|uniref:sigma-E factor negative regulatory protein n=1 Tax=Arhodomonas sp. AD133 TaxID=3415009 RepID=UPI003EBBF10B